MLRSPIIVIGTPRSGTSIVTKWLIDNYSVMMCLNGFTRSNEEDYNLHDTYEDDYVVNCNSDLNTNSISLKVYKQRMKRFFKKMKKKSKGGHWGFKDPRLTEGLSWILDYFGDDITILRTKRRAILVIKSMVKNLGWTEAKAVGIINGYEDFLNKAIEGRVVIDVMFDGQRKMPKDFTESFNKSLINLKQLRA